MGVQSSHRVNKVKVVSMKNNAQSFTDLEKKVFNHVLQACHYDYSSSAKEIASELSMNIDTVKGVLGSLTKKGMVEAEGRNAGGQTFKDVFPVINGEAQSFMCDKFDYEEIEEFKID